MKILRTKKALYNNISAAILQITTLIFGLIIPRYMIGLYGSEINGLISSSKQLVSYLQYLEVGLTATLIYSLYKPLAKRDYDEINPLVTRAKNEYEKIGLGYFIGVIVIAIIYPIILRETIGYTFMLLIIFIIGLNGVLDLITVSKYRVLLTADQKYYVVSATSIIMLILQNITSIILLLNKVPVLYVLLVPVIFYPLRSIILRSYIKRKYSEVDYKTEPSNLIMESRIDAFISGLSNTLNVSLPIVIVSLIVSLEMASVFSVYSMIFIGLTGIISIFTTGMSATFGNMFANNERDNIIRSNDYFEFIIFAILAIVYSVALGMTIPFVKIYTANIADINYIYPTLAILFTIWSVFHNSRIPNQTMISASGNWKMGTKIYIIQIVLLLVFSIVFGYFFSLNGILISMIIASTFKTIAVMYISNKKILGISNSKSIFRLIRVFIIIGVTFVPIHFNWLNLDINNFGQWIIKAITFGIWTLIVTFIINFIFDKNVIISLYNRYVKKIF